MAQKRSPAERQASTSPPYPFSLVREPPLYGFYHRGPVLVLECWPLYAAFHPFTPLFPCVTGAYLEGTPVQTGKE